MLTEESSGLGLRAVTHIWEDGSIALSDVTLPLLSTGICVLVGANGAGKSTALSLLAGVLSPTKGEVGFPQVDRRGKPLRRHISFVSQERALDPEMTGRETLSFFAHLEGLRSSQLLERVGVLTGQMGLTHLQNKRVGSWSGGEQQRLHLAVGALREASLLLLDEPFAGLDVAGRELVWNTLRAKSKSATVVVATHLLEEIAQQCDNLAVLQGGRLVASGAPQQLIEQGGACLIVTLIEPLNPDVLTALRLEFWVEFALIESIRLTIFCKPSAPALPHQELAEKVRDWLTARDLAFASVEEDVPDILTVLSRWLGSASQHDSSTPQRGTGRGGTRGSRRASGRGRSRRK